MRWYLSFVVVVGVALTIACGGGDDDTSSDSTPDSTTAAGTPTERVSGAEAAVTAEANSDPSLPGEFIDLPAIYGGPIPYGPPPAHRDGPIDYSAQGLPPVGGLHWGPDTDLWPGPCAPDPAEAAEQCAPVPSGIYRTPWAAEALVHNMEHAEFVIWYNTPDEAVRDELEAFAVEQNENGVGIVMAPYPDMATHTVAITVWSRRLTMAADAVDLEAMQEFVDVLHCRFDPEGFC